MKTKVALSIGVVVLVFIAWFFLMRPAPTTPAGAAPTSATTSQASPTPPAQTPKKVIKDDSQPTFTFGSSTVVDTVLPTAAFDSNSFTSTSTYPTVTGTANVLKVGIAVYTSNKVGVVGTLVPVTQGHWSYSSSVVLAPGTYTLILYYGSASSTTAKLIVEKP